MTLSRTFVAIVSWVGVASMPPTRLASQSACTAVDTMSVKPSLEMLRAGEFAISFVATSGSRRGAVAQGEIRLRPTSPADRSPRNGRGPERVDTLRVPLVGSTSVDLRAVGAPMDDSHPHPSSLDPIYPGVLVNVANWEKPELVKRPTLLIGTILNARDGTVGLDGAGIVLVVLRSDAMSFAGTWDRVGRMADGAGHFCAVRRSSAPGAAP